MNINIICATGDGRTELSAFDDALYKAGVANYNLITLSSVIPPGSKIEKKSTAGWNDIEFGQRLYCVMSRFMISTPGEQAWSGIGWVQAKNGAGLFVEHHASSEAVLNKHIEYSLEDMLKYRKQHFGSVESVCVGIECVDKPVCALVIATYFTEAWVMEP